MLMKDIHPVVVVLLQHMLGLQKQYQEKQV
uniref:Uncharacterized protein n=1 Tax=Arundo donax TaxID=35708 RepID=A0A0A8ZA50_ARUDO